VVSRKTGTGTLIFARPGCVIVAVVSPVLAFLLIGALTPEQWQEDVAFLAKHLPEKHVNAFTRISREQFEAESAKFRERIPSLREHEIRAGIMRLVASIGDAHTGVRGGNTWRLLPLQMAEFEDGVYVVATSEEYSHILGGRVQRIGKMSVDAAIGAISAYIPSDNETWSRRQAFSQFIRMVELLHVAGIADTPERVHIETTKGAAEVMPDEKAPLILASKTEPPIARQRVDLPYWAAVLGMKTLYFQYNRCFDNPQRPMKEFTEELMRLADTPELERIVLDLRMNSGGDSSVLMPWMHAIQKSPFNAKGKLFVLIGPNTFSSALLNAYWMHANTSATLVGEPTGGKPNRFGDLRLIELPNSKIQVSHSTKRFTLIKDADPPSLMPDRTVRVKFADYMAGRDPVLESVIP
jgi:hypothetical protein